MEQIARLFSALTGCPPHAGGADGGSRLSGPGQPLGARHSLPALLSGSGRAPRAPECRPSLHDGYSEGHPWLYRLHRAAYTFFRGICRLYAGTGGRPHPHSETARWAVGKSHFLPIAVLSRWAAYPCAIIPAPIGKPAAPSLHRIFRAFPADARQGRFSKAAGEP